MLRTKYYGRGKRGCRLNLRPSCFERPITAPSLRLNLLAGTFRSSNTAVLNFWRPPILKTSLASYGGGRTQETGSQGSEFFNSCPASAPPRRRKSLIDWRASRISRTYRLLSLQRQLLRTGRDLRSCSRKFKSRRRLGLPRCI